MQAQEAESKGDPGAETELLEGPRRRRKEMGKECCIIISIYCFLQTDPDVTLKPGGD